jgi:hypothetical protein
VQHPREFAPPADRHFPNRQVNGKRCPVPAAAGHLATDSDDVCLTRRRVPSKVVVVLFVIGRGHQYVDVAPNHFRSWIAEQPFGSPVERLDAPFRIDDDDGIDR